MTRTTPLRLTILHFLQIFFTDACTFMENLVFNQSLFGAEHDPCARKVIGSQLHCHLVTRKYANVVHTHLSRNVPEHNVPIFKFYPEGGIWQVFNNFTLHLDYVIFGQCFTSLFRSL